MAAPFDSIRSAAASRAACPICLDDLVSRPGEVGALTWQGRRVEQALYHRSCVGVAARGGIPQLPGGRSPITRALVDGFVLIPPLRERRNWRNFVDWNGDGRITVSELSSAVAAMLPVDEDGIERVVRESFPPAAGDVFSEEELEDRILPHLEAHAAELAVSTPSSVAPVLSRSSTRAELLAWFRHWDADGSGSLDAEELRYALATVFFRALGSTGTKTKQAVVEAFLNEARLSGTEQVTKSRFLEHLAPALQVNLPEEAAGVGSVAGRAERPAVEGRETRLTLLLSTTGASVQVVLSADSTLEDVRRQALERLDHGAGPGASVELFRGGQRIEGGNEVPLSACAQLGDGAVVQVLMRPAAEEADRLRRIREELARERNALPREREELEAQRRRHEAGGPDVGARSGRYAPGIRVTIVGLRGAPELNGRVASIVRFDEAAGRYVADVEGPGGGHKSLRPESLTPHADTCPGLLDGLQRAAKKAGLHLQMWAAHYDWWQLFAGACVVLIFIGAYFQVAGRYAGHGIKPRGSKQTDARSQGGWSQPGPRDTDPLQHGDRQYDRDQWHHQSHHHRREDFYEDGYDDHHRYGDPPHDRHEARQHWHHQFRNHRREDFYEDGYDQDDENRHGGLLDGLDQTTLLLLAAGFGFLCWKGIIPLQSLDFWQMIMLWNFVEPILFGGRRRRGHGGMGSFGPGFGGLGMGYGGFRGFGRRGFF